MNIIILLSLPLGITDLYYFYNSFISYLYLLTGLSTGETWHCVYSLFKDTLTRCNCNFISSFQYGRLQSQTGVHPNTSLFCFITCRSNVQSNNVKTAPTPISSTLYHTPYLKLLVVKHHSFDQIFGGYPPSPFSILNLTPLKIQIHPYKR